MGLWIGRTVFVYLFVLIVMRIMGRREIGKLSIFDLVVSIMIAELSAIALEDPRGSRLWHAVATIALLAGLQLAVSQLSLRSSWFRRLIDGRPVAVIEGGHLQEKAMGRLRYNLDDLMMQLREKGIFRVDDVELALMEPSGKLSVWLKEGRQPVNREDLGMGGQTGALPVILVLDGEPYSPGLARLGRDSGWLKQELAARGYPDVRRIFYAHIDSRGGWYVDPKDSAAGTAGARGGPGLGGGAPGDGADQANQAVRVYDAKQHEQSGVDRGTQGG
ncbi:MAG: DUF421 domain-containing protein [Kyrpidia tusciae]|nr:DUF421 domain-containing protein [Kyrpidia tusciae]MBE3552086.1 DUF421 domain-containing protein [Kyrpidia tusciae]